MSKDKDLSGEFGAAGPSSEVFTIDARTGQILYPKTEGGREYDGYGRDVTDWINVGGKQRPHP